MKNLDFYEITDLDYIVYLQEAEKEKRGFTRVPNIMYSDRNKFMCGVVLNIHDNNYYVSVSSKAKHEKIIL